MRAAILAVGSELLSTDRIDSHSLRLAALLELHGIPLVRKAVVADDEEEIAAELTSALARTDLILVTGGLGPTADDVTREGCARALGLALIEDPQVWEEIERRFASFGRAPSENNRRQALVPAGASVLANPRGTAPGLRVESEGRTLFLLPGVPHELEGLVDHQVEPWLAERSAGGTERRTLRVAMRPESEVDRALEPAYRELGRDTITVLASPGEVRIRLSAAGSEPQRRARLDAMEARIRELLGDSVFGVGDAESLESVVGALLADGSWTVATAESCTGGLVAERLTRVPGSSAWFPGGVVAYSDRAKRELLGIEAELIARHGAVSEPVARALAESVRSRFHADLGIGITGVAGPGGGSDAKPVGTVHVAVAGPDATRHRQHRLPGDRERVRQLSAQAALAMARRALLELRAGESS